MRNVNKEELHNIFEGIASNNEILFNELYEKYGNLVYGIAFSILKNKENSEDIVQKVFFKIWKMDKDKLPKECEATWLYELTKNETLDFLKTIKMEPNIDELYYISDENKEISEVMDQDSYNRIITKLNWKEQEIISLKILSNLSFKEISQILNIPIGTVKWKYYKSIHTLKLLLGNLGMFIITFTMSLKIVFSNQRKESQLTDEIQGNDSIPDTSTTSTEQPKTETSESYREDIDNTIKDDETHQIVIQEQVNINNYYEIGILSVSAIFLIFTIIFAIIFAKHQLKRMKKSSK